MIILISSDGSNITALNVPSSIQHELAPYLAPGVVMVSSVPESQHAMTVKVKPATVAESEDSLHGDVDPDLCGLPKGTVMARIEDDNGGAIVLIEAERDNDRDAPALWVCAQDEEEESCEALFDREGARQLHSALSSWLARYRAWEQERRETVTP